MEKLKIFWHSFSYIASKRDAKIIVLKYKEDFLYFNKYNILFGLHTMATKPDITAGEKEDPITQPSAEIREAME